MATPAFTLGIEEEYQVLDVTSGRLKPGAKWLLSQARHRMNGDLQPELKQSQIEIASTVCETLEHVRGEVAGARAALLEEGAPRKTAIGAASTHPAADWRHHPTTQRDRYRSIVDEYQQLAREQLIFGCHVHVGVPDRESAVQVMNGARVWLAPLLALSASSPFWDGEDTGYASYRTATWSRWPLSGPPPHVESHADYEALIEDLVATGAVEDASHVYWDLRLAEPQGTVEFRVMDVCQTVDEAVMITGLTRALVRTCYEAAQREAPSDPVRGDVLRAAQWRAARYGLEERLFDARAGRLVPAHELVNRLLTFVRDALEAEGDWDAVAPRVAETLARGNGAQRQRAAYERAGRWEDVVALVREDTGAGLD